MKLLVLAQGYPSPANPVAGAYHKIQFERLAQRCSDMTVVVPVPYVPPFFDQISPKWKAYADLPEAQDDGPVHVVRPRYLTMPRENRLFLPHVTQTLAVKSLGLERPDAILAFFGLPTGAVARNLAKDWGVPYVVSLLGDDVTVYPYYNRFNHALFKAVMEDAARIVANSPALAHEAEALSGVRGEWLSIGIDFDRFAGLPPKDELRRALGLPVDQFLVSYVGNLIEAKGVLDFKAALDRIDDLDMKALIVGNGPLFAEMDAHPKTICVGAQPYDLIPQYMAASDFLVLPSHQEGLGMVIVEAAAVGKTVLGSDTGGISDLLGGHRGYLFAPRDPLAMAEALRHARANPEETAERARKLHAFVRESQDVFVNSDRLFRMCTEAAGKD